MNSLLTKEEATWTLLNSGVDVVARNRKQVPAAHLRQGEWQPFTLKPSTSYLDIQRAIQAGWEYVAAPPLSPAPELTEAVLNEALALWKSGVHLQRRSTNNEWIDIPRPSLAVLMAWMAQYNYLSIRAAPPKPREYWSAEYKYRTTELKVSGHYRSEAECIEYWSNSTLFVRAVKFVEVI